MRKQWFGDSRDYVKWSCIRHEAGKQFHVVYAVMLRPDSFNDPRLDPIVAEFFDTYKNFRVLEGLFPVRFEVVSEQYEKKSADRYFARLTEIIQAAQKKGKVLVFLDPDTGIEPAGSGDDKHLRARDIKTICNALGVGDKVVIYQHALRDVSWIEYFSSRLKQLACETHCDLGTAFHAPGVAKDVCFFTLTKNSAGQ